MSAPAYTLTGNFENLVGTSTGFVTLTLSDASNTGIPLVISGTGLFAQILYTSVVGTNFSVTVYGNDVISPATTVYQIDIFSAAGQLISSAPYFLSGGGTHDLSTLTPANIIPPVVPTNPIAANLVYSGPTSGAPGNPTFRSLVANDLPPDPDVTWDSLTLSGTNTGTGMVLAPTATGTVPFTINAPTGITSDLFTLQVNAANFLSFKDMAAAPVLTTSATSLSLIQTGDFYGATSLILENRTGANGVIFQNFGLPLVDFLCKAGPSISTVAVTSNVVTITFPSMAVPFSVGNILHVTGATGLPALNNSSLTVLSASPTQITANFVHANYGPTSETGTLFAQGNIRLEERFGDLVSPLNTGGEIQFLDGGGSIIVFYGALGANEGKFLMPINLPSLVLNAAPTAIENFPSLGADTTTGTVQFRAYPSGLISSFTGAWNNVNVTPVSVAANVATAQNLMSVSVPAGTLNRIGRTFRIHCAGVYSTPAASTATLTFAVTLGTLTLLTWTTAANAGSITNNKFLIDGYVTTQTAGAAASFEASGTSIIDLGALSTAADTVYSDTNSATIGTLDTTVAETLQVTIAFSVASASNSCTQRQMIIETIN